MKNLRLELKILQFSLSNICNSHCKMCDIGSIEDSFKKELSLKQIHDVLHSVSVKSVSFVILSGGEPFLRRDILEIIRLIREHLNNALINISTNGLNTKEVIKSLEAINKFGEVILTISLDSIGKIHDIQRGLAGAFDRTIETIKKIRKRFPNQRINIHFTITPLNYKEILRVYHFAQKNNLFFRLTYAHNAVYLTNFRNKNNQYLKFNKAQINKIKTQINSVYRDYIKKGFWQDALFINQIPETMLNEKYMAFSCITPTNFALINEKGDVQTCVMLPPIGNINKNNLDYILMSEKAKIVNDKVRKSTCPNCMMLCGPYLSYDGVAKVFEYSNKKFGRLLSDKQITKINTSKDNFKKTLLSLPNQNKELFLSFQTNWKKIDRIIGDKIISLLSAIEKKKIKFTITTPLPRCLFGINYQNIIKKYKIPKDCSSCRELFILGSNGTVYFCNKLKSNFEFIKNLPNSNTADKFLKVIHKEHERIPCFPSCSSIERKKCNYLCIKLS